MNSFLLSDQWIDRQEQQVYLGRWKTINDNYE